MMEKCRRTLKEEEEEEFKEKIAQKLILPSKSWIKTQDEKLTY